MQSSMSKKIKLVELMQFYQKYISKFAVNAKVSGFSQITICMFQFDSLQDHQEALTQRFREASFRMRRAITPPHCRGSVNSESRDSAHVQESKFWHFKRRSFAHSKVRSGCSSCSRIRSDSRAVRSRRSLCCLSVHQEVAHKVKECSRTSRQCHAGEDSVHSECEHQLRKESGGESRKESNPIMLNDDYQQVRLGCLLRYCLMSCAMQSSVFFIFLISSLSSNPSSSPLSSSCSRHLK